MSKINYDVDSLEEFIDTNFNCCSDVREMKFAVNKFIEENYYRTEVDYIKRVFRDGCYFLEVMYTDLEEKQTWTERFCLG